MSISHPYPQKLRLLTTKPTEAKEVISSYDMNPRIEGAIIALERKLASLPETVSEPSTHVIGKTKSGKDIHSHYSHPEHGKFNWQDHNDAAVAHIKAVKDEGNKDHHVEQARKHHQKAEHLFKEDMDKMGL